MYKLSLLFILFTTNIYAQQFARTADRLNYTSGKPVAHSLKVKWQYKTNGYVIASPVLFQDLIITGSATAIFTLCIQKTDRSSGNIRAKDKFDPPFV